MADITIVNGVYKPTYNWGAPSCATPAGPDLARFQAVGNASCSLPQRGKDIHWKLGRRDSQSDPNCSPLLSMCLMSKSNHES